MLFRSLWKSQDIQVGLSPRTAVWKKNKATLWYYPSPAKKYETPLFLVYSLVNQAYILDLGPGTSMIEGYIEEGYDVYMLDFGIPGYEDKDLTLGHYIVDYIQTAVRRALRHSGAKEVTLIGYCLGGTLAVIYAALATEPIKNLILFAAPLDFSEIHYFDNWHKALKRGELEVDDLIDVLGIIPDNAMKYGFRFITGLVNLSPYLALLGRMKDEKYVAKWQRFEMWAKGHVPFTGAAIKDVINDLLINNKLINNEMMIRGQWINLENITSNLLLVSTEGDQLIPEEMSKPLLLRVSSQDKTYKRVKGGHVTLAIKGGIPEFLIKWLEERS